MNIRTIEKEWRRIDNIIKNPDYNPIHIFNLSIPYNKEDLKKSYVKIIRLLHPDKTWNNTRFCKIFTIVNDNYKLLQNPQKRKICIKALKPNKQNLIKELYKLNNNNKIDKNKNNSISQDLRIIIWKPQELIKYMNNIQKKNIKIISKISMTGAEHRKNKSKVKKINIKKD